MNINKKFGVSTGLGLDRLQTTLNNARIQDENNALYQTIMGLIQTSSKIDERTQNFLAKDAILPASQISGLVPIQQNVYLPVIAGIANVTASSPYYTWWTRIGNIINIWGKVTITPTAANVLTQLSFSLPFPSAFLHEEQLSGTINGTPQSGATANIAGICKANPVDFTATFEFFSSNTDDNDFRFVFSYLMIAK